MKNVLIVVNAADIPVAIQTAKSLSSCVVYVFDPLLVDRLSDYGIRNVEFIALDDAPAYIEMDSTAHAFSRSAEDLIAEQLHSALPDVSVKDWQHINLYYFFMTYQWYTALWMRTLKVFENCKLHVFLCANRVENYEPSFFPALLLLQILSARGVQFSAVAYEVACDNGNVVIDLPLDEFNETEYGLLTHLPTCGYDYAYINSEIQATGKRTVNLMAKRWNVQVVAHSHVPLKIASDAFNPIHSRSLECVCSILSRVLDDILKPYIATQEYRTLQVKHWVNAYLTQIASFDALTRYFMHIWPAKILLSDHDAGFHGPLVQFAKKYNIPLVLFPHSKTCGILDYGVSRAVALTHPIQGGYVRDAADKVVPSCAVAFPERYSGSNIFPQRIQKIGLLLNAPSLNGIFFARYRDYMNGVKSILDWGKRNDIQVSIRCKPGYTFIKLLTGECGLDESLLINDTHVSMEAFMNNCDLCVMFDHPTSAAISFLNNSIPIVHATPRALCEYEKTFVNSNIVPSGYIAEVMKWLDIYLTDLDKFAAFRKVQFHDYLALSRDTLPLRAYI